MKTKHPFLASFQKQILENGSNIAIKYGNEGISYDELYGRALSVYHFLKKTGRAEKLVAFDIHDGIDSYAYLIGIWLYGAAYVPLNLSLPKAYITSIQEEAGLYIVLGKENKAKIFTRVETEKNLLPVVQQDLAYVLFTSGTSGKPKGVCISKTNLHAFLSHYLSTGLYQFSSSDKFLQSYELNFDVSVFCFALPLMIGATLVLPHINAVKYLSIAATILKEEITVCSNVPSTAMHLFPKLHEIEFPSLRYCFFSGEALFGNWALAWMKAAPNAAVYNCYGPTETTIVCTKEHLNVLDKAYFSKAEPLPLGSPFEGMDLKLVDGEVCFAGEQVFPEYLTGEKGRRLRLEGKEFYATGDLGVEDESGKLIFKGRIDEQIQVNGYRIELSAIDVCIFENFGWRSKSFGIVDSNNSHSIVTAIASNSALNVSKVKEELANYLPPYHVPQRIVHMNFFPLNQNEKLDKTALRKVVEKATGFNLH